MNLSLFLSLLLCCESRGVEFLSIELILDQLVNRLSRYCVEFRRGKQRDRNQLIFEVEIVSSPIVVQFICPSDGIE